MSAGPGREGGTRSRRLAPPHRSLPPRSPEEFVECEEPVDHGGNATAQQELGHGCVKVRGGRGAAAGPGRRRAPGPARR